MLGKWWARTALALLALTLAIPFIGGCPPPPGVRRPGVHRPVVRTAPPPRSGYVTAPALSPGGASANGVVSYPGHRIRYPVSITYPRTVNIYVSGHGLDPTVAVYNAAGGRIGFKDDGGSGFDSNLILSLAPGTYFIEVAGYGSSTGSYTLMVR